MRRRILFYCQPLLGLGHLTRSLAILRGLTRFDIWMVNGGRPLPAFLLPTLPPHLTIVQLPPLQADPTFQTIESAGVAETSGTDRAAIEEERRTALFELLRRVEPEIILIELFPFGRLPFAGEILPLLDAARAQAAAADRLLRIVCSLRDILVEKRDPEQFEQFVIATANRYFDLILVHADPAFQRLDETFPKVGSLTCPVVYTGYVAERGMGGAAPPGSPPPREALIVASIGGGRVGSELLDRVAIASQAIQETYPHRLLLLTGPYIPEEEERALRARWGHLPHLAIERFEVDFVGLLRRACLSISLAGYNTSMNVLISGVPAILSPYTGNRNREQSQRAARLAAAGWIRVLPATPETTDAHLDPLQSWMKEALSCPTPERQLELRLDGVETTARLLEELLPPRADQPAEDRSGEPV